MDTLALTLFQLLIFQLGLLLTLNPPKSKDSPFTVPVESDHHCLCSHLSPGSTFGPQDWSWVPSEGLY